MDLDPSPLTSLANPQPQPRPPLQAAFDRLGGGTHEVGGARLPSAIDARKTPAPLPREEVLTLRRPAAAPGDQPVAERQAGLLDAAARLREAALRATRTPAVEIIARLSQERSRLKEDLARA